MPEGDTIYRAAVVLHRALAGARVVAFESPLPRLGWDTQHRKLVGRTVERVESRGKYLIIRFSGDLALLTHLRMHGSWHLYRPGERWRAPRRAMRIRLTTTDWEAVGFDIPVAELHDDASLSRAEHLVRLGPDLLAGDFDPQEAMARLRRAGAVPIEEALLDQRCLAGVGNVLKSEILFLARLNPFSPVENVARSQLARLVAVAQRVLRDNVAAVEANVRTARAGSRNTTRSANPAAKLSVYGRAGRRCRRCGATIRHRRAGRHARSTYWCPVCQA
jgi:endonuclease VIII